MLLEVSLEGLLRGDPMLVRENFRCCDWSLLPELPDLVALLLDSVLTFVMVRLGHCCGNLPLKFRLGYVHRLVDHCLSWDLLLHCFQGEVVEVWVLSRLPILCWHEVLLLSALSGDWAEGERRSCFCRLSPGYPL